MHYEITVRTDLDHAGLEQLLGGLTATGPFAFTVHDPRGGSTWTIGLAPRHPGIDVGFAKVAELQLLLCRHAEILSVARADHADLAAAS